jgi:hypothetical protein
MANNRLYIIDTETGDKFCLAKSMGDGWYLSYSIKGFEEWANKRDYAASYECYKEPRTKFILRTENEE